MSVRLSASVAVLTALAVSGCASVDLRDDVFVARPLWESPAPLGIKSSTTETMANLRQRLGSAPALVGLLKQCKVGQDVLGPEAEAVLTKDVFYSYVSNGAVVRSKQVAIDHTSLSNPLPQELADSAVVKSICVSALTAFGRSARPMDTIKVGIDDMKAFGRSLNGFALGYPMVTGKQTTLSWPLLFQSYLTAYYKGNFVDRMGTTISKPQLALTITNDTITALEHVFLESLWDWILLAEDPPLRVPLVYKVDSGNITWLVANGSQPTMVDVYMSTLSVSLPIKYIAEQVAADDDKNGISAPKLCLIRTVSGLAADAAQGTSGAIVRALGGANLGVSAGLGVLGKLSIGDNDTLTQLVDAWTESTGRRSTEIFASELLYDQPLLPALKSICPQ